MPSELLTALRTVAHDTNPRVAVEALYAFGTLIFQVITGAVGFEDWEWGVTLFARDPLDIKRVVTELRYDEASAKYGEFGEFFIGVRMNHDAWPEYLAVH